MHDDVGRSDVNCFVFFLHDTINMNEGWLELESDPGLFTLLVEEFGVHGVQVEEIYDLQKPIEGPVYGFIFLFKWIEERRARRKVQPNADETYLTEPGVARDMFFAHQKVPNSCATHALLSILLNCPCINLGGTLSDLKRYTKDFSAENKGYAIGNVPVLAQIHNSHAHPEPKQIPEKQIGISTTRLRETFHFVSYVPINERLIELDGLKPHPIDHGPWGENEDWTEKFRRVIGERLENEGGSSDIRFNLMAVVGDRCHSYEQKLDTLKNNKQIILDSLDQLVRATHPHLFMDTKPHPASTSTPDPIPVAQASEPKPDTEPTRQPMAVNLNAHPQPSSRRHSHSSEMADPYWDPSHELHGGHSREKKKKKKKKKHKKHQKHSKRVKTFECIQSYRPPPALDTHNYAKSPLMSDEDTSIISSTSSASESEGNFLTDDESDGERGILKKPTPEADRVESSGLRVTFKEHRLNQDQSRYSSQSSDPKWDVTKQLSVQTVFDSKESLSPSSSSASTDTASELGSAFNSPVCSVVGSRTCSPNTIKLLKFQHWKTSTVYEARDRLEESIVKDAPNETKQEASTRQQSEKLIQTRRSALKAEAADKGQRSVLHGASASVLAPAQPSPSPLLSQHGKPPFEQNDLLELLKSVEAEIDGYEQKLLDEKEKRNKYKVDDCRRSHNYDPFICTFLSMLAEQGKLACLVEKHTLIKRRQGVSLGQLNKKTNRKRDRRRKRTRPGSSVPTRKRKIR